MRQLASEYLNAESVETLGVFDVDAVEKLLARIWQPTTAVQGSRDDIIFNHLVGLHVLHKELVAPVA